MLTSSRGLRALDPMRWHRVALSARSAALHTAALAGPRYTCAAGRSGRHRLRLAAICTQDGLGGRHHSTSGHGHAHDHEDDHGVAEDSISMRFARGESFTSIFLSQMTKKAGVRIGMVGLACAASGLNVLEPVLLTVCLFALEFCAVQVHRYNFFPLLYIYGIIPWYPYRRLITSI